MFVGRVFRWGVCRQPLLLSIRRGCLSYPIRIKNIIESYKPTTVEHAVKTLDYLYSMREFMPKRNSAMESMVDRVEQVLEKNPASRSTLQIYSILSSVKLLGYTTRNLMGSTIAKTVNPGSAMTAQKVELAYFMATMLPYHSALMLDLTSKTLSLNDLEQKSRKFTNEVGYLSYSKLLVLLKTIGFDVPLPEFPVKFDLSKLSIQDLPMLMYNVSLLCPDRVEFSNKLLDKFLEADSIRYDKYLHRVEYIDLDQDKNMTIDNFDVASWHEISLLCRAACNLSGEIEEESQHRMGMLIERKLQTEDVDFYTAVDIIAFANTRDFGLATAVVNRCLQSVRELQPEDKQDIFLDAIVQFLKLVRGNQLNEEFFQFFSSQIPTNRMDYTEQTLVDLRDLYRDRSPSDKLKQFLAL